jgi:hypothetical protein
MWSAYSGVTGWDIGANDGQSVDRMLDLGFGFVVALEPAAESWGMPDEAGLRFSQWWDDPITTRTVPCMTLDGMLDDYDIPDLVKIDTEGGEELVLKGAPGLLAERKTSWLIEFHSPKLRRACTAILEAAGYQADWLRNPHDFADHDDPELDVNGWIQARP